MSEVIKKILNDIYPALILEDIVLHRHRKIILQFLLLLDLVLAFILFFSVPAKNIIEGSLLICFSLTLVFLALEAYFYSLYRRSHDGGASVPFEIGEILYYCDEEDITKGFIFSDIGDEALRSLQISEDDIASFLKGKDTIRFEEIFLYQEAPASIEEYVNMIVQNDKEFDDFLALRSLRKNDLVNALDGVVKIERSKIEKEMWWTKDVLSAIIPLGKRFKL